VSPEELHAELREGRLRPAYLLAGSEALLRDDAVAALRAAALGDGPADFDLERLDGEKAEPGQLADALRALPVLAEHRLVVLREPEARRRGGGRLAEALAEQLPELAEQRSTVLVVVAERADRRARWVNAFREPSVRVDCEPPRGLRALLAFIRSEAKRQGVRLGSGAAEALAEAVGPQLLMLRGEIHKAALLAGPGAVVERSHVMAGASQVAEESLWDLADAVGEGRTGDALVLLTRLLEAGAPAPVLLSSLAAHFRKLTRCRCGGRVAGPPFAVRKLAAQARRSSESRLLACLEAIHQVDEVLKGQGGLAAKVALERLVMGLSA